MLLNRRGLLVGLGSLIAAPAVVRAASLMPVRGIVMPVEPVEPVYSIEWGVYNGIIFHEAPTLEQWGASLHRDEVVDTLYAASLSS